MAKQAPGPFDAVDPKLTIYALANGMDLAKEASSRRLEWYRDGRERGIVLEATTEGALRVTAQAWSQGDESSLTTLPQGPAHAPNALVQNLSTILDQALDAANGL